MAMNYSWYQVDSTMEWHGLYCNLITQIDLFFPRNIIKKSKKRLIVNYAPARTTLFKIGMYRKKKLKRTKN